ncbi:MAG: hypothetical protein IPJ99_15525 [Betaproteobacteria bacterium]|nr:hypothetical protein [Betaproteobacteria bacterium]MBK8918815.1 hypothetical protein [Betaproteobacteria bacterium]
MRLKNTLTVALALCALNLPMAPAHAHAEHGKPQFGGVVAEAGEVQFEIVGKDGRVTVHVSNHGNPVDVSGASAKLTVLSGADRSEVELKPVGGDRLEGQGSIASGAKLLVTLQWPGKKPLQGRAVMR